MSQPRITEILENLYEEGLGLSVLVHPDSFLYNGWLFSTCHQSSGVADDGYLDVRITVGAEKNCRIFMRLRAEGKAYTSLYEGTTFSAAGTLVPAQNDNRDSANTATTEVRYNPTIDAIGDQICSDLMPGLIGSVEESNIILKKDTEYLLRIQNKGGTTKDLGFVFDWVEI